MGNIIDNLRALRKIFLTSCFLFIAMMAMAQNTTVTGVITDEAGEPVVGVAVRVMGSTQGVVSDVNGKFTITCPSNAKLEVSYIGFATRAVEVKGQKNLKIVLSENAKNLDEVVVTALGIKREAKALGYAATTVNGSEIERVNTISPVAALQGKVAGVEINQGDGGMFGSTKIQIRGASTLGKNNQPIFVVDGVILDNATSNSGDADWDSNINDYGNQLKNLNPDDFAEVTVLKGAAATALYGSRGLNGAVVITTKNGSKAKGLGITFSQTVGFDQVYKAPDLQNEYLMGLFPGVVQYGDVYNETGNRWADNMTSYARNSDGEYSMLQQMDNTGVAWGPHISWAEGKQFEQFDGTMGPTQIFKDNYTDAYQTGVNTNTNFSLQGGNDRTTFYASTSYKYNKGTVPNNTFKRFSFLGKASQKIGKNIRLDFSINFSEATPRNAANNLGEYFISGTFPREYDVNAYRHHYKAAHGGLPSSQYGDPYASVPGMGLWWSIYENNYEQKETMVRPIVNLTWDATKWLTLSAGGNLNYYYIDSEGKYPGSGYANEGGSYSIGHRTTKQQNVYAAANVNYQINDDFEVHGFARWEYLNQTASYHSEWTNGGLIVPNQYFIKNSKTQAGFEGYKYNTKRIGSLIFAAGASWKDQLFLDITGRNDWSSSLVYTYGKGNFSYFYPSVSGSWIITETFKEKLPSWVTFAKLRASWAQVGHDTDPYYINSGYTLRTYTKGGNKVYGLEMPNNIKSTNLKPERKNSWEVGLDWRFLDNRIGLDFTYYSEDTKDQIMEISVPSWSGVSKEVINAGKIRNNGIELALNTTPIKTRDWQWDLNFTYTRNRDKIVSLSPDVANWIVLSGSPDYGNYRIGSVAKIGSDYGLLMSDAMPKRDKKTGKMVVGYSNSYHNPWMKRSGVVEEIGSMIPDFLGSINTTLRWKNLSLYTSFDMRFGGYVASYGSHYGTAYGFSGNSLKYRVGETWTSNFGDRKGMTYTDGFIPDVVFDQGVTVNTPSGERVDVSGMTYQEAFDKGYVEYAHLQTWCYFLNSWGNGVVNDDWYKKLNYIALREITLTYDFPRSVYQYLGAQSLRFMFTCRNVGYLLNTAPNHENPEAVRGTTASEFRMRSYGPFTRNFLFTLSATF